MTVILDPGALLAAKAMAPDRARSALPNAPLVPDQLPGAQGWYATRRVVATGLARLAEWVRPRETQRSCRLASGR